MKTDIAYDSNRVTNKHKLDAVIKWSFRFDLIYTTVYPSNSRMTSREGADIKAIYMPIYYSPIQRYQVCPSGAFLEND